MEINSKVMMFYFSFPLAKEREEKTLLSILEIFSKEKVEAQLN